MSYNQLKTDYIRGWHTWNVRSVLSHVHMPDGFALNIALKEFRNGHYLKETLVGRFTSVSSAEQPEVAFPGVHAFDESYTDMTVRWCGMEIRIESTIRDDELVLLITPVTMQEKPALLILESGFLWGRDGYVTKKENTLIAHAPTGERPVYTTGTPAAEFNVPTQAAYLSVLLDGPVAVTTGKHLTLPQAQALIAQSKKDHTLQVECYGDMKPMYEALESALMWDTIYDPKHDRVVSPVSRLWSIASGGYVLFCWDNFFAGFMAALGSKELSYSNLREILNEQTANGFVPNFAYATGQRSEDRSQPPVGSAMLLETYRIFREKWIVEDMFDGLLEWNRWFFAHRANPSGALCWGSEMIPVLYGNLCETLGVHDRFGAALESGLDNSPMYDNIPFNKETSRLELEDVGLTGLYILDCRSLLELARLIGRDEVLAELQERMDQACQGMENLWDEEFGFYCNRHTDTGKFSHHIAPTNFYALFSPNVSPERQQRIAAHYFNPDEFYGEWMLPSIARNDPGFLDQEYWRGRVWAPLNFLTYLALSRTDLAQVRRDLAEKSAHIFMKEWSEHRHVHENYSAITGEGCDSRNSDKFYHWGALLCILPMVEAGLIPGFGLPLEEDFENK